jgi:hypothetical protein
MDMQMSKTFLLVPKAWMGAWGWDGLNAQLKKRNYHIHTLTLRELNGQKF